MRAYISKFKYQSVNKLHWILEIGYWKCVIILFVILSISSIYTKPALADTFSIGVYPPIIKVSAKPPADVQSPLSIINHSDAPVDLIVMLRPFIPSPQQNGVPVFQDMTEFQGNDPDFLSKVGLFENGNQINQLHLAPQEQKNLTVAINIPQDEPSSDYYFSIIFISKDRSIDQKNGSSLVGGVAINTLVSIGTDTTTTGFLKEFSAPLFLTGGPVPFLVNVQNTSVHFITPRGQILIHDIFGKTVGDLSLLPVNILSNSARFIPDDSFNSLTQAVWNQQFLLGPYSAHLTIALSDKGPIFTKTIYFFAMPIQGICMIFILIVIFLYIYLRIRKKLKQRGI